MVYYYIIAHKILAASFMAGSKRQRPVFCRNRYIQKSITGGQKMEDNNKLHYGLSLRLYFEEKAFGPGMVALLRAVEKTGSLQRAARSMNMAYSKAWKMLRVAEKEWGFC